MRLFLSVLLFFIIVVLLPVRGWGQVTIFHEAVPTFTEIPVNWESNNGGGLEIFQSATNGYLLVDYIDDWVVTESYDLSLFDNIQLNVDIASYGGGDHNFLTIEVSEDNGDTWNFPTLETNLTTGTIYETQGSFQINTNSNQVKFRFRREAATGRGIRFRNILLTGEYISCGSETFSNLPTNSPGSYLSRTWIADDELTWSAEGARTDQFINGSRAIAWGPTGERNLITPIYNNGIGILSFKYVRAFTGTGSRRLEIYINNYLIEEIAVSNTSDDLEEYNNVINIPGDVVIEIRSTGVAQVKIDDLAWTCYERPSCLNTTQHYRSVSSGNWDDPNIWQSSTNENDPWLNTSCPPDYRAQSVTLAAGHNLTIDDDTSLQNIIIESGATLVYNQGFLNIMDINNYGILIEGTFVHNSNTLPRTFEKMYVNSNGIISIERNIGGPADFYAGSSSVNNIVYETGSILNWNVGTAFSTGGITYFPDLDDETVPVFRVERSLTLGGNLNTIINGVFDAQSDITWQGTGTKTFRNGIIGSGHLTQASNSGTFIINGSTATIGGSGQLILNENGLEISSENAELISDKTITGGPVNLSGTLNGGVYTLNLGGNVRVTGSGSFAQQTSTVNFNGTSLQTISGMDDFHNLTISNPAGIETEDNISIFNELDLNGGDINLQADAVLQVGVSATNRGSLIHNSGKINGRLKRWFNGTNSPLEGYFPIGSGSFFHPATIQFTTAPSNPGSLTAMFISGLPENYYSGLPFTGDEITFNTIGEHGYWEILTEPEFGMTGGFYRLSLNASSGFVGLDEPGFIRILKRENEDHQWTLEGVFESYSDDIFVHSGMSGFSEFVISGNFSQNPLPIELIHFSAEAMGRMVKLNWATASEINNDFFTLERSTNMREIEIIGRKPGAGNSNSVLRYSYTDRDPHPGISYYRLKQTDYDGSYEYSEWVAVSVNPDDGNELEILRLFQQDGSVFMLLQTQPRSNLEIRVSDIYGREVHHERMHSASETMRYSFVTNTTGLIFINISDGTKRVSGRLVIQ